MRALLLSMLVLTAGRVSGGDWRQCTALPDMEGFAGCFAGISHGALLVAGGANFPDAKPWDGGKKVWYDTVFVLERPNGSWKRAGKLLRPLGYGVSVSHGEGVVCVGGSNADGHYADAFRLEWKGGQLQTTRLASLSQTLANACGAVVGDTLYIAGGQSKPDSTTTMKAAWKLDLSADSPEWTAIEAWPGRARMLSVAAGQGDTFWLVGGTDLLTASEGKVERQYLKDAYRYRPGDGWRRIADLPHAVVAAPSPAPTDATGFYIVGGDDGGQIGVPPDGHQGFLKQVLRYDVAKETWIPAGEAAVARVVTPCVRWGQAWVIPSGEVRPAVRSPQVWSWTIGHNE